MTTSLRVLLVAIALLSSGVAELASALGDHGCCPEEQGAPCPPSVACSCCPARGAVQADGPDLTPSTSPGVALTVTVDEPSPGASASGIFHPPRA